MLCPPHDWSDADGGAPGSLDQREFSSDFRMRRSERFVLQDGFDLRALHAGKPREKLLDGGAIAEIFKQRSQRHACTSKHPRATQLLRVALHGVTILPVLHMLSSCAVPGNPLTHSLPNTNASSRGRFSCD